MPVNFEKLNGNGQAPDLKRPNLPAPPALDTQEQEKDTQSDLQDGVSEEVKLQKAVVDSAKQRGSDLAVKANVAEFSEFASTNVRLKKQMRQAFVQLDRATARSVDAIQVEAVEGTDFFSSISDFVTSPSFASSGRCSRLLGEFSSGSESDN